MPALPDNPLNDYIKYAAIECRNAALLKRHLEHTDPALLEQIQSDDEPIFRDGLNRLCDLPFWFRHFSNQVLTAWRLRHYLKTGRVIYPNEILAGLESELLERAFQATPNGSESNDEH